jgi:hypothetical protein
MINTEIKLTLTLEEINYILGALGDKPFVQVVNLIAKVRDQADPQVPKQETIVADELVD